MNARYLLLIITSLAFPGLCLAQECDTFISSLPYQITQANKTYCLDAPVNSEGKKELSVNANWARTQGYFRYSGSPKDKFIKPAIYIRAENVTLDFNGVRIRNTRPNDNRMITAGVSARGKTLQSLTIKGQGQIDDFSIGVLLQSIPAVQIEEINITNSKLMGMSFEAASFTDNQSIVLRNNTISNLYNDLYDDASTLAGISITDYDSAELTNNTIDTVDSEAESHRSSRGFSVLRSYLTRITGNTIKNLVHTDMSARVFGISHTCNPSRNGEQSCDAIISGNTLEQVSPGFNEIHGESIAIYNHSFGGDLALTENNMVNFAQAIVQNDSTRAPAIGIYAGNRVAIYQPYVQGHFPARENIFLVGTGMMDGGNTIFIAGEDCDVGITALPFTIDDNNKTYCLTPPDGVDTMIFDRNSDHKPISHTAYSGNDIVYEAAITVKARNVVLNLNNVSIINKDKSDNAEEAEIGIFAPNISDNNALTIEGNGRLIDFAMGIYAENVDTFSVDSVDIISAQLAGILAIKQDGPTKPGTRYNVINSRILDFHNDTYYQQWLFYGIATWLFYESTFFENNSIENVSSGLTSTTTNENNQYFVGISSTGSTIIQNNHFSNLNSLSLDEINFVTTAVMARCEGASNCDSTIKDNSFNQSELGLNPLGIFLVGNIGNIGIHNNSFDQIERAITVQIGADISGSYANNVVRHDAFREDGTPADSPAFNTGALSDDGGNLVIVTP